jgi:Ca-activated chloride channel family protein
MTTKLRGGLSRVFAISAAVIAVSVLAAGIVPARAQQGNVKPPPVIMPGVQGKETSTLELPSMPAKQGGDSLNIRPQVPQPAQELVLPTQELRQQPGYEQVTVTVTDPNGTYVTGLQKQDFKLYLDGQQRPIQFFRQDLNTPVSVGIVVDTSGSMVTKIPQVRAASAEFIRNLNDRDDIFMYAFSARPFLLQAFTTNHEMVKMKLRLLRPGGQTALFDVILQGLNTVQRGRYDKKALLVITDGVDDASAATVDDVVRQARRTGVLVYSIGIGSPHPVGGATFAIGPFAAMIGDDDWVDAETLHTLSTETGAKTYIIAQAGDGELLRKACENISLELREQYTVGFLTPDPGAGGYRKLRVEVPSKTSADVRVRKGVEVGRGSSPAGYDPAMAGGPPP